MKLKHKKEMELKSKVISLRDKKQKKSNTINKLQKGITLIALVITIIVLLILAGVSIATLTGDNGILTKAQTAKEETEKASVEEQRQLAQLNATMHTEKYDYETEDKGEDGKPIIVPIPAGFAPTQIEGENSVEEGLVITDENGNEFVWIPCEYDQASVKEGAGEEIVYYNDKSVQDENFDNRDSSWKQYQFKYNGGTWYDKQPHTIGMESIKQYHGFYVARYEAGVPKDADFYASKEGDIYYTGEPLEDSGNTIVKNTDKYIPVSKKGNQVWNYISQKNAKTVAENMVNNSNVKSYLIDSHAWNTICRLIKKKDKDKNLIDSTKWGNYPNNLETKYEKLKGLWVEHTKSNGWVHDNYNNTSIPKKSSGKYIELATGICEDFKAYNIYDLAGNMMEWTTETGQNPLSDIPEGYPTCKENEDCPSSVSLPNAVLRGGSFNVSDYEQVVYAYGNVTVHNNNLDIGFRVVLYLKPESNE